jgi:hypothetical protein
MGTLAVETIALFYHNLLQVKPSIMIRLVGHESRAGKTRTIYKILVERPEQNMLHGDLAGSGSITLKWRI